jgi:2-keto-4-pentenoate hydratase/2-oxohepta-3-ene-1,7-dioic acid hydratase in catechol pathway
MRIARFIQNGRAAYGLVDQSGGSIMPIHGTPFSNITPAGDAVDVDSVRLLAPVAPTKVIGWGFNYPANYHPRTADLMPPLFLRPPTSIAAHLEPVPMPPFPSEVVHEAELAVVVGRKCRDVPERQVNDVILGYTVANDLTATDLFDPTAGQWTFAKSFDSSCPLGPWIETDLDPADIEISLSLDGEPQFSRSTSDMINSVSELISLTSRAMTLLPGDVVITSAPYAGAVCAGQTMAATIAGIGTLINEVVEYTTTGADADFD